MHILVAYSLEKWLKWNLCMDYTMYILGPFEVVPPNDLV